MGLAADPDFTENLLMRYLPKAKIDEIYTKGVATIAWGEVGWLISCWCLLCLCYLSPPSYKCSNSSSLRPRLRFDLSPPPRRPNRHKAAPSSSCNFSSITCETAAAVQPFSTGNVSELWFVGRLSLMFLSVDVRR